WLFAIGYALVLGSLLVKTYRIDRIFNSTKKMYMKISDVELLFYLGIIVLVEVILLLMRQFWIVDDSRHTKLVVDISSGLTVSQNACAKPSEIPDILLYVWNAIVILVAAVFAYQTRNVKAEYNENIFTVAAIAIISVISLVIVPVLQIINSSQATYMLVSIGTILGTMLPICVFAVPKLLLSFGIIEAPAGSAATSGAPVSTIKTGFSFQPAQTGTISRSVTVNSNSASREESSAKGSKVESEV
ncbi:hypothetical protein HK097_008140, partial [Rhizophlyctis rosea]